VASNRIAAWFLQVKDFTLSFNSVLTLTHTLFGMSAPRVKNPLCHLHDICCDVKVISSFDFAFMLTANCLFASTGVQNDFLNALTQHFCVCCIKRYLKRSILVHHGLNDKTRIVSGAA
jgi:hypothetical protein